MAKSITKKNEKWWILHKTHLFKFCSLRIINLSIYWNWIIRYRNLIIFFFIWPVKLHWTSICELYWPCICIWFLQNINIFLSDHHQLHVYEYDQRQGIRRTHVVNRHPEQSHLFFGDSPHLKLINKKGFNDFEKNIIWCKNLMFLSIDYANLSDNCPDDILSARWSCKRSHISVVLSAPDLDFFWVNYTRYCLIFSGTGHQSQTVC